MPLITGTRLGSYEIAGLLGTGGMGEVYRARDMRLHRDVAVKVLPEYYAGDPEWLVRFEREAQLLAQLNHPHVAQIYGFEGPPPTDSGHVTRVLVMELVDGPTLADRIENGAVPLDECLTIARQIAEALEAAHERGIIHRDLKPANIKLTPDGAVKVLDFGLAKVREPLVGPTLDGVVVSSPTIARPITASGVILGTAAYMAPEQARGKEVDKRVDIWAFGVVLYEMLAGCRPFQGETLSDTVAAVLQKEIDWTRLPGDTPDELRRMLRRCLTRDPKDRLHDAADARLVLTDVQGQDHAAPVTRQRARASWRWLGVAAIAIAITGVVATWRPFTRSPGAAPLDVSVRFAIEPPQDVMSVSSVAISGDGRFVVYEGQVEGEYRLFVRRFDAFDSRPLAGTEGARGPFISPDGAWIGFFRGARLYKVSMTGGEPLVVCKAQGGSGAAWNTDGRIIFSRAFLAGLSIVSADGGTPTTVTTPDPRQQEIGHWWPSVLPSGQVLFTIVRATIGLNDARIGLLDPKTGKYRVLFAGARAAWLPSGHIVFYRTGRYHAVRFEASSSTVTGEPFPVLEDAQELDPAGDFPQPVAVGQSGALAYLPGPYVPLSRLTWIDASGRFTPLTFAPRPFVGIKLSPDSRRIATASLEAGRLVIRLFDLERGADEALNLDGMNWNPVWLPDGKLSFTSMRKGDFDVYVKEVGGSGAEHAVLSGPDDTDPIAWTRDGRLVFQGSEPDNTYPLKLLDPRGPSISRLTEQHVDNGGSLSPDDRWLAYQSAAGGRSIVYVRTLAGAAPAVALSRDSGEFPIFLRDGRTLALVRGRQLLVRPWRDDSGVFEVGPERIVTPHLAFGSGWTYGAPYDVADDGRFIAFVRTAETPPPRIRVVLGWDREVTRRASRDQ
jgi:eukaryotic-like serine/threonine-protein kinase